MIHAFWLGPVYDLLEDRCIADHQQSFGSLLCKKQEKWMGVIIFSW